LPLNRFRELVLVEGVVTGHPAPWRLMTAMDWWVDVLGCCLTALRSERPDDLSAMLDS
jgi:hypothetical protein